MKRPQLFSLLLCLVIGICVGGLLPMPWEHPAVVSPAPSVNHVLDAPSPEGSGQGSAWGKQTAVLDSGNNFTLLSAACQVNQALHDQDYAVVASYVDPVRGVTFTPYSTVNFDTDLTFTAAQIQNLAQDKTVYTWGTVDGRGSLIEQTMAQYFQSYVYDQDYTQAPQIGVDRIQMTGNALENLKDAYPDCRFVDFSYPELDPAYQGLDWCSLRLVFAPETTKWRLVGIVHGQWTI